MIRVDGIVGNVDDPDLADAIAAHEAAGTLETVTLDSADRRKSRLRVATDTGTDLGVLVDKPELAAGDVLVCDDDRAVVVAFESREAFVIELPQSTPAATVELGHRIGNQHWDIAVEDRTVYIPVEADRAIIEDVLGPYLPEGAETRYETVDADRFVEESTPDHDHGAGHGHDHGADHGRDHGPDVDHGHSHDEDHEHSHSHDGGHSHD
ncbi:urease accessory protein UreE [Halohasta salina]|uniref:urease accessory protein UreE n=1 Tax=Halohasta salina TaxID=2961621 RepID=UPI0026E5918F|nr:urease accessory protein UreE [Halohasta salina]